MVSYEINIEAQIMLLLWCKKDGSPLLRRKCPVFFMLSKALEVTTLN